ncbi:MAG: bacteriohemerythrin [Lachnospiraceae bacterium]|nr:bacteriohemerythrin [Lachnospiraceae bacterium]
MFTFTQDCMIGIEQLDKEHEYLFHLLNQAFDLLKNEYIDDKYSRICELVEKLKDYADTHFEHEEAYMKNIQDPELEMQKKQHLVFQEKMDCFAVTNIDGNQDGVLSEILEYMTRWLYNHILSSDMMIGKMQPLNEWRSTKNPCAFTEEYLTGISKVDEQHKRLFEIIGDANELVNNEFIPDKFDNISALLNELTEYTKSHFQDEEVYMESIQYEGLAAQKRAHAGFIAKLEEIELEGFDENQQEVLLELIDFLFNWLVQHILKMDKRIPNHGK